MVLEAKKHWLSLIPAFCYLLIFLVLFFNISNILVYLPDYKALQIGVKVALYVIALIFLIETLSDVIIFFTTELCFTDQRLIGKVGLFKVRALLTPLNKINHVASTNGLLGTFLHYGNIHIHTSSGQVNYEQIDKHLEFINSLMDQIKIYEIEVSSGSGDSSRDEPRRPSSRLGSSEKAETKSVGGIPPANGRSLPGPQVKTGPQSSGLKLEKPAPSQDDQLTITCSKCNATYSYKPEQAGQSTVCRKCGQTITVPKS